MTNRLLFIKFNIYEEADNVNFSHSWMACTANRIIGFLLVDDKADLVEKLQNHPGNNTVIHRDLSLFKTKKGIELITLLTIEAYRHQGIGQQLLDHLFDFVRSYHFHYAFGEQYKAQQNLDYWLRKGRHLIAETPTTNFTAWFFY